MFKVRLLLKGAAQFTIEINTIYYDNNALTAVSVTVDDTQNDGVACKNVTPD
jgi:hypothetical protein